MAIIYRSELVVAPLFSEFHSRNFLLARLSSHSAWPVLLLVVYFPPDVRKVEMTAHFVRTVEYLRTRYRSFGLIVFGDLNADFAKESNPSDCKRMMRMVKSYGLEINRDRRSEACTSLDGDNSSYLDYFLTTDIKGYDVFAQERIGSSDHCCISCQTFSLAPVKRRR